VFPAGFFDLGFWEAMAASCLNFHHYSHFTTLLSFMETGGPPAFINPPYDNTWVEIHTHTISTLVIPTWSWNGGVEQEFLRIWSSLYLGSQIIMSDLGEHGPADGISRRPRNLPQSQRLGWNSLPFGPKTQPYGLCRWKHSSSPEISQCRIGNLLTLLAPWNQRFHKKSEIFLPTDQGQTETKSARLGSYGIPLHPSRNAYTRCSSKKTCETGNRRSFFGGYGSF